MFKPRPNQQQVLEYRSGRMAVSAVPGSGKTTTLSMLAANLISDEGLSDGQEVLIVTLVNSAVDNFSARVSAFIKMRGLLPNVGYRVRTLHGLAHDIVRERPDLAGVSEDFEIADELTTERILRSASDRWAYENTAILESYLNPDLSQSAHERIRRRDWPNLIQGIADAFIKQCKDYRISPFDLGERIAAKSWKSPLVDMGQAVYEEYEKALNVRGLLDFNDLIVRALQALETDPFFLEHLRLRWPYILEDEAQDSSRLQERILRTLVGSEGNWVRVGDPNQAIFETFTTASPEYLRDFTHEEGVLPRTLPNSGRSTESIIELANRLIDWTESEHPVPELRGALSKPFIEPAPPGDPQPNPSDVPEEIHLVDVAYTAQEELEAVVRSAERWVHDHPKNTVAILVPRNERGAQIVEGLKSRGVPCVELLRSTEITRSIAQALSEALRHLAGPNLPGSLAEAFSAWRWGVPDLENPETYNSQAYKALRSCKHTERFVWPMAGDDWVEEISSRYEDQILEILNSFRPVLQRWHSAAVLPIDQLMLTISQDLRLGANELALVYKLALALARIQRSNPSWQLLDLAEELERIANNQRRFIGFGDLESAFEPENYPGKVIVATIHKSKGLEWDRVYLLAVNQYNFPSLDAEDIFISERWFLRDKLNLQAETLSQLAALMGADDQTELDEGEATYEARVDYAAERLRLFYVGITRAKQELVITWNQGRRDDLKSARPFRMLMEHWKAKNA